MTLSQIVLFPLTGRFVPETKITEYELGLVALAKHIERNSPTRKPVKANAKRTGGRKAA